MEEANNKLVPGVVAGIVVLLLIVLGLVAFNRTGETKAELEKEKEEMVEGNTLDQTSTLVTHSYADGVHTYRGVIQAPTPCHTLTHEVELSEEAPIKATIHFTLHPPAADELCAQVITDIPFEVSFEAPENIEPAGATLNGEKFYIIIGGKE